STVSRACRYVLRRPPTNPFACFIVFLWRRRVFGPPFARGMGGCLLEIGEEALDRLLVRLVHERRLPQPPLLLPRLGRQDVSQVAVPALHLALGGHLEALGRSPAGLHLRHRVSPPTSRPASSTCCGPPGARTAPRWQRRPPSPRSSRASRAPARGG